MNERKQKTTIAIASLVVVLSLVLGISFAYFAAQGQSTEQSITTSNMGIEFGDGTAIVNASGISPLIREDALPTQDSTGKVTTAGKAVTKKFTIENTGTEKMYIHISLEDMTLPTNLKRYDFMWSLYEVTDTTNNIEKNVSNGSFDGAGTSLMVAPYQVFEAGDEKTYNLYIWIEETHLDQSIMMGQTFKATIQAEGEVYYTSPESDFEVNSSGVLTAYNGTDENLVIIPSVVNSVTVTKIAGGFLDGINNIIIPNTVTEIGSNAFENMYNLTNIFIPNSVTSIGEYAFASTSLKNISIPNSVTSIGEGAFMYTSINGIFIPNTIKNITASLFMYNSSLKNIIIPNSVNSIGGNAFMTTSLEKMVIPNSVNSIGSNAFDDTPLTEVIIIGRSSIPSGFESGWNDNGYNGEVIGMEVIYKP